MTTGMAWYVEREDEERKEGREEGRKGGREEVVRE